MGTPIDPNVGNEVQGGIPDQETTPGLNPAWNEVLNVLPEQFHSVVTPHFQKWDQSAQQRIEQANSSLKEFEAYKPFVEHGITSEELEQGIRLMYEINNNPQNVYNALAEAYKFGQSEDIEDEDDDDPPIGYDPELMSKLEQQGSMIEAVSQIVLNDAQAKQAAQADFELNSELEELKKDIGEYDERYVLAMMQNGMTAQEAGQAFIALKSSFNQSQPFAPVLLGSGGGSGIPSNKIDPTKLSSGETRNLVAQMLEAASRNQ